MKPLQLFIATAFVFLVGPSSVSAQALNRCVDLFSGPPLTSTQVLERLDEETRGTLLGGRSLDDVRADMGLLRRWKLKILERRLKLGSLRANDDFSSVAADLQLIFIEPRLTSLDVFRFLKSGDRLYQAWIKREILRDGLQVLATDPRIEDPVARTIYGRALQKLRSKLPQRLPFLKDREIPRELLVDVLEFGIESQNEKLRELYGPQKSVDLAKALKPYLNFVGFTLLSVGGQSLIDRFHQQRDLQAGQEFVQQMEATKDGLDEVIIELKRRQSQSKGAEKHTSTGQP